MSNIQTTQINGNIWKLGKSGNIDFCGNFLKLREKEPKTAALLLGHEQQEGYECEDSEYKYKIYHSQYGYSVGRRKKPVFIPETQAPLTATANHKVGIVTGGNESKSIAITPTETIQVHTTNEDEINSLKVRVTSIEKLLKKICESYVMNQLQ